MAEAVGLAASIAALSGIAIKTMKVVKDIRNGPAEKEILVREILDVQVAIVEVEKLQDLVPKQSSEDLALSEIKTHIQGSTDRLEKLLAEVMVFDLKFTDMMPWKKALPKSTIGRFQNELQSIRKHLALVLGIISMSRSVRTEVAVGNLTLQRNDDRRYLIQMSQQTAIQLPALFSISKCQQSTNEKLQEIQDRLAHVDTEEPRSTTVALNVKPRNIQYCKNFCRCSCHVYKIPWKARSPFGTLLVDKLQHRPTPIDQKSPCDSPDCRQRTFAVGIAYLFPLWLFQRVVLLSYKSSQIAPSITFSVSVRRAVKPNSVSFHAIVNGRVDQLHQLFSANEATPSDVHCNSGETPLHWAIKWARLDSIKALLDAGADPYSQDIWKRSPIDFAWFEIMAGQRDTSFLQALKTLLGDKDHFELRRLNPIHQRTLGITSSPPLQKVIELSTLRGLNAQDEEGITALAWAALRGDIPTMKILLTAGADPNLRDSSGETSLGFAACSTNPAGIRLLLQHGAEVIPNGRKVSPVHRAIIRQDDERYLRPFVESGLHLKWFREPDDVGDTPLILAVWMHRPRITIFLVDNGLDINQGPYTPLSVVIEYGVHASLRQLLAMGADPRNYQANSGDTVLHLAAKYGDEQCFAVLSEFTDKVLRSVNVSAVNGEDSTALQIMRRRSGGGGNCSLGLLKSFEDLLERLQ